MYTMHFEISLTQCVMVRNCRLIILKNLRSICQTGHLLKTFNKKINIRNGIASILNVRQVAYLTDAID